ncbi:MULTISPECIES: nitroreductase/quinone reductase family protein [unclassified Streptomyces]|uniref:nitroreductase/quinone reductase family protein n=1 Tax=unclassified Streptomyces TaxID=2593676 RepID=UPI0013172D79|nr:MULTISPECIES: nitroreductase/quinone reductase family protein [unclassified Streptomyces]QHC33460.1 nitroreductase family deazaflavin-dependent oxidoreductase [Streptomyces sp. HF10]WKE73862.1 nitroreductase/quinone reductase family protein [Streptomyces sp. WP-1]
MRVVRKVSASRGFARVAPYVIPALDRGVHRLTRGRRLLSTAMLPGVVLTSEGARSGLPRRTPLACIPEEGREGGRSWILVGSNFGRPGHPAWTHNLLARPRASISWRGADVTVTAVLLEGEERAVVWAAALAFWPPYAAYQRRISRQIRLFRLTEHVSGR